MNKMQETIDVLKREALNNNGALTLSSEQSSKIISLLEAANKLITHQGQFIEEMKADLFKKDKAPTDERSW